MERGLGPESHIDAAATIRARGDLARLVAARGLPQKEAILLLKALLPRVFPRGDDGSGAGSEERAFMSAYLDLCLARAIGDGALEQRSRQRCLSGLRSGPVASVSPAAAPEVGGI